MFTRDKHHFILQFRFVCLLFSMAYFIYQFTVANYDNFGIHFRYLTIWGLTGALIATLLLYNSKRNGKPEGYFAFVSAVAVLNAMVVFLYWKLYFVDPNLVNYSGSIVWYQEYYLHLIGPLLLIVDSLFFNDSFRQFHKGFLTAIGLCLLYIFWTEIITAPLNNSPEGSANKGFPYPFLNNMRLHDRILFYATTILTALAFYSAGWIITKIKFHIVSLKNSPRSYETF